MTKPLVLLTNDDGVEAGGLRSLSEEMAGEAEIVVVAPFEERSGVGHGLTMRQPLRVIEKEEGWYALTGTPVDCVIFAVRKLLPRLPDLVISGINQGANLGDDVHYSGTVAGAREAALYGVPAVAASLVTQDDSPSFAWASRLLRELVGEFMPDRIPKGTYLNVNIPEGKPKHYRFTRQGSRLVTTAVEERKDARGNSYYWIGRDEKEWEIEASTDYQAVREGAVSVTPLHRDQTDYRALMGFGDEKKD